MKKTKEVVAFFAMLMVLAIPVLVLAAPVIDTGQSKCYDPEGNQLSKCPVICENEDIDGNPIACERKYEYVDPDNKKYTSFYNGDGTKVFYVWTRTCYDESGASTTCDPRQCYDKATKGTNIPCPTTCYSTNNPDTRVSIPCPGSSDYGTGTDDYYGQDANYTMNSPSYSLDGGDDSVLIKDERTGLMWLKKEDISASHDDSQANSLNNTYTLADAEGDGGFLDRLNAFGYKGYDDWRLPTVKELASIVNGDSPSKAGDPAVDSKGEFSEILPVQYWTDTSGPGDGQAYCVDFSDGSIVLGDVTEAKHVIAIRNPASATADFVVNDDETITDNVTGLMWRKLSHAQEDWEGAMLSCEALEFADFDDWRLPSRAELLSIVDYTKASGENALIDSSFAGFAKDVYWTSTTYINPDDLGKAWTINFTDGTLAKLGKMDTARVLAVRGGQNELGAPFIISVPTQTSVWKAGRLLPIVWSKASSDATISISRDGGKTFDEIDGTRPLGDNSLIWTVTEPVSDRCLLKIESTGGDIVTQGLFSIEKDTGGNTGVNATLADIIQALQILAGK